MVLNDLWVSRYTREKSFEETLSKPTFIEESSEVKRSHEDLSLDKNFIDFLCKISRRFCEEKILRQKLLQISRRSLQ